MEGHRHEKVAIVLCAYIIGFTTAFIGFGVNSLQKKEVPNTPVTANTVEVVETVSKNIQKNIITSVSFGDDGLYAVTPAGNILLSVNKSVLEASVIGATRTSGYYFAVVDAESSRDGKFVYFCEQLMESDATCDPYVYDLQGDILHKVSLEGSVVSSDVKTHASAWDETGVLTLNGNRSMAPLKPWELGDTSKQVQTEENQTMEAESEDVVLSEEAQVQ